MSRIHPNGPASSRARAEGGSAAASSTYTVWKRSSMGFQGTDGFSVYDAAGGLAFRVDNYSRRPKPFAGELTLMNGHGGPLLSLRPQILSLRDRWNCYRVAPAAGEEGCSDDKSSAVSQSQQLFSMRKCSALQSTDEAEVYMSAPPRAAASSSTGRGCRSSDQPPACPGFRVDGCFSRRSCKISGSDGQEAARISRKKSTSPATATTQPGVSLGDDVFSLVVRPGVDTATVMAIVVVMDRISRRPYTPLAGPGNRRKN